MELLTATTDWILEPSGCNSASQNYMDEGYNE